MRSELSVGRALFWEEREREGEELESREPSRTPSVSRTFLPHARPPLFTQRPRKKRHAFIFTSVRKNYGGGTRRASDRAFDDGVLPAPFCARDRRSRGAGAAARSPAALAASCPGAVAPATGARHPGGDLPCLAPSSSPPGTSGRPLWPAAPRFEPRARALPLPAALTPRRRRRRPWRWQTRPRARPAAAARWCRRRGGAPCPRAPRSGRCAWPGAATRCGRPTCGKREVIFFRRGKRGEGASSE